MFCVLSQLLANTLEKTYSTVYDEKLENFCRFFIYRPLLRAISLEEVHQQRIQSFQRRTIMYTRSKWVQKQDKTIF